VTGAMLLGLFASVVALVLSTSAVGIAVPRRN
jgi:hypothetical protein